MKPLSPVAPSCRQRPSSRWYCSWKRMNISPEAAQLPGIEPRMPTVSGLARVSERLTAPPDPPRVGVARCGAAVHRPPRPARRERARGRPEREQDEEQSCAAKRHADED